MELVGGEDGLDAAGALQEVRENQVQEMECQNCLNEEDKEAYRIDKNLAEFCKIVKEVAGENEGNFQGPMQFF